MKRVMASLGRPGRIWKFSTRPTRKYRNGCLSGDAGAILKRIVIAWILLGLIYVS